MTVPSVLRQLHASLAAHAPDQLVTVLQEAGYAAGEGNYRAFAAWLRERAGVDSPANLDAGLLVEMLSEFFTSGVNVTVPQPPLVKNSESSSTSRSEEHTSELQSLTNLVCSLQVEK